MVGQFFHHAVFGRDEPNEKTIVSCLAGPNAAQDTPVDQLAVSARLSAGSQKSSFD
jgi:hypothetical protein